MRALIADVKIRGEPSVMKREELPIFVLTRAQAIGVCPAPANDVVRPHLYLVEKLPDANLKSASEAEQRRDGEV